jgi:hypothetical protein
MDRRSRVALMGWLLQMFRGGVRHVAKQWTASPVPAVTPCLYWGYGWGGPSFCTTVANAAGILHDGRQAEKKPPRERMQGGQGGMQIAVQEHIARADESSSDESIAVNRSL